MLFIRIKRPQFILTSALKKERIQVGTRRTIQPTFINAIEAKRFLKVCGSL